MAGKLCHSSLSRIEIVAYAVLSLTFKHTLLSDMSLERNLTRQDRSGRMIDWGVELGEFDMLCLPRPSIKARVLADLMVECIIPEGREVDGNAKVRPLALRTQDSPKVISQGVWVL